MKVKVYELIEEPHRYPLEAEVGVMVCARSVGDSLGCCQLDGAERDGDTQWMPAYRRAEAAAR